MPVGEALPWPRIALTETGLPISSLPSLQQMISTEAMK